MLTISQEALTVLLNGELDKDELIGRLLQFHPDIFVKLMHIEDLPYQVQLAYYDPNDPDARPNNKVRAIKKYRELTGTDLKTAKKNVEDMLSAGLVTGHPNYE